MWKQSQRYTVDIETEQKNRQAKLKIKLKKMGDNTIKIMSQESIVDYALELPMHFQWHQMSCTYHSNDRRQRNRIEIESSRHRWHQWFSSFALVHFHFVENICIDFTFVNFIPFCFCWNKRVRKFPFNSFVWRILRIWLRKAFEKSAETKRNEINII